MSITQQRVSYIEENEYLSANEIIENWKGTKYALRRQDALHLIRITRGIKPKTPKERKKYIPIKYRKLEKPRMQPEIELPEQPEGTYRIATLKHGSDKYFIKFQNERSLTKQINIISQKYGFLFSDATLEISPKEYSYTPFIDYEYAKEFA